jgi:hypothetical protein
MSESKCDLMLGEPIVSYDIMRADGALFEFFREFSFEKNRRPYKDGYICCALDELHREISDDDILLMEKAQKGVFELLHEQREELVRRTERFHVIQLVERNGYKLWTCNCYDYYLHKWCRVSAAHQHKERLLLDAPKIPGNNYAPSKRKTSKQRDIELIRESRKQKHMKRLAIEQQQRRNHQEQPQQKQG